MTPERKQEIREMPWLHMVVTASPMGAHGLEGYNEKQEYLYKTYLNDSGKEIYIVTNHNIGYDKMYNNTPEGDVSEIGRNSFLMHFKPLTESKMEENKDIEKNRMRNLVKSFDEKGAVLKETNTTKTDESKVVEESNRLKEIARIDEYVSNNQFAGDTHFTPGNGQTVNTFMPTDAINQKYNPNYTYLQPAEALNVSIKRTLESGAPVKDMGFYEEVNWNLNNMGFLSKLPLDIKNALIALLKDSL